MMTILKISFLTLVIFLITSLQSSSFAQDKNKKEQKQNTGGAKQKVTNKPKPVFDPATHPVETDSIVKMKKRADKGDANDYNEFMKTQKNSSKIN